MSGYIEQWTPTVEFPAAIYIAVNNNNGNSYVGYTTKKLQYRAKRHGSDAAKFHRNGIFGRAIRKHGFEAFSFYVIAECSSKDIAPTKEVELIAVWKPEYNTTNGGLGRLGDKPTEETRAKMRAWHAANEHKPWLGKKRPEISAIWADTRKKPVICITDGIAYASATDADKAYGFHPRTVAQLCNPKAKYKNHSSGRRFKYVDGTP